jgi:DnaJ-class molecular chaperone
MLEMINFYQIFEIMPNSSINEIINAYQNKISKYNNLPGLSNDQIKEIKLLKTGLHILTEPKLRQQYNKRFINYPNQLNNKTNYQQNNKINYNPNIEKSEDFNHLVNFQNNQNFPLPENQVVESNLDSVFNIDNSWMKHNEMNFDNNSKKNRIMNNILGDRVFSLPQANKKPFPSDFETQLRKPLTARDDKSELKINKNAL